MFRISKLGLAGNSWKKKNWLRNTLPYFSDLLKLTLSVSSNSFELRFSAFSVIMMSAISLQRTFWKNVAKFKSFFEAFEFCANDGSWLIEKNGLKPVYGQRQMLEKRGFTTNFDEFLYFKGYFVSLSVPLWYVMMYAWSSAKSSCNASNIHPRRHFETYRETNK